MKELEVCSTVERSIMSLKVNMEITELVGGWFTNPSEKNMRKSNWIPFPQQIRGDPIKKIFALPPPNREVIILRFWRNHVRALNMEGDHGSFFAPKKPWKDGGETYLPTSNSFSEKKNEVCLSQIRSQLDLKNHLENKVYQC